MDKTKRPKPVVIAVLDGYGITLPSKGNAVYLAKKPVIDSLIKHYPCATIQASGELVGLPWGEMGNSEVGHMNIGAGRVMYQDMPKIDKAIVDGSFFDNEKLLRAINHVKKNKSNLHVMGLLSSGGVHSHIRHLYAIMQMAKKHKVKDLFIHAFMDGRDVPPRSGIDFVNELQNKMKKLRIGKIASLSGRYWAMDRDENWDRIQKAFMVMVNGEGETCNSPVKALEDSYKRGIDDENFIPTIVLYKNKPTSLISNNDAVIHFDYRSDRARQMVQAFVNPEFNEFNRKKSFNNLEFVTLTDYGVGYPVDIAYPVEEVPNSLGEIISKNNMKQLRIAETEKFIHVSMFFNCGKIDPFPREDRLLIPSPDVKSYDLKPEMSAYEITEKLLPVLANYDFVLINFANPDMVGHTGIIPAAAKGIEAVDACLGKIIKKVLSIDGSLIITADHGNADVMLNLQTGEVVRDHTTNPVPLILVSNDMRKNISSNSKVADLSLEVPVGVLADVAVTALDMMKIVKPPEMTGISLSSVI